jgi:hypothetical protein
MNTNNISSDNNSASRNDRQKNNIVAVAEFHVRSSNTSGHYLERVLSLAEIISRTGAMTCFMSSGDRSLLEQNYSDVMFDEVIFEPAFNSFGQVELNCLDFTAATLLKLFQEAVCRSNLVMSPLSANQSIICFEALSLIENTNFFNLFSQKLYEFYAAAPEATIELCRHYLKITNFSLSDLNITHPGADQTFMTDLLTIWVRIQREESALVNICFERILNKYSSKYSVIIFPTASINQLLNGIRHVSSDLGYSGATLVYILHQPKDFTQERCYEISRELSNIKNNKINKLIIFVSSEEFKSKLSSHKYSHIGEHLKVAIGPFFQRPPSTKKTIKFNLNPNRIVPYYLELNKPSDWTLSALKSNDIYAQQFYQDLRIFRSSLLFSNRLRFFAKSGYSIFTFLGDIRDEKNFSLYVHMCMNAWNLGKRIIAVHPTYFSDGVVSDSKKAFDKFVRSSFYLSHSLPYTTVLDENDYISALELSDVIFNAYDQNEYAVKQSGIFYETLLLGRRSCILPGTAMAIFMGRKTTELVNQFNETASKEFIIRLIQGIILEHRIQNDLSGEFVVTLFDPLVENIGRISVVLIKAYCNDGDEEILNYYLTIQSGSSSSIITKGLSNFQNVRFIIEVVATDNNVSSIEFFVSIQPIEARELANAIWEISQSAYQLPVLDGLLKEEHLARAICELFECSFAKDNKLIDDFRASIINKSVDSIITPIFSVLEGEL